MQNTNWSTCDLSITLSLLAASCGKTKGTPPNLWQVRTLFDDQIGSQLFRWFVGVYPPRNGHFVGLKMTCFSETCLDITTFSISKIEKHGKTYF